ncbi:unnamed protein product, partial [Staurois parvus]
RAPGHLALDRLARQRGIGSPRHDSGHWVIRHWIVWLDSGHRVTRHQVICSTAGTASSGKAVGTESPGMTVGSESSGTTAGTGSSGTRSSVRQQAPGHLALDRLARQRASGHQA